ncbi:hypothetical protein C2G38_2087340 [Gigaspora rosea]|uniref:Uncharacterized protein n=1 Tax=Gigaspora rosea TaxID=44941 RepID=A0A397VER4_9GLOM|nr:hypothetical protein C2G38_2087340 [Gigaspora rosea]
MLLKFYLAILLLLISTVSFAIAKPIAEPIANPVAKPIAEPVAEPVLEREDKSHGMLYLNPRKYTSLFIKFITFCCVYWCPN